MNKVNVSFLVLVAFFMCVSQLTYSQEKLSIAILNLQAGVSRSQSQVDGLSDILTVELHNSGAFIIKERLQVDKVLSEMQLLSVTTLDEAQRKAIGAFRLMFMHVNENILPRLYFSKYRN